MLILVIYKRFSYKSPWTAFQAFNRGKALASTWRRYYHLNYQTPLAGLISDVLKFKAKGLPSVIGIR